MAERSGRWKANVIGKTAYKSFVPSPLPPYPPIEMDHEMLKNLLKAHRQLSLWDGMATRIPNINLFVSMYVRKEALLSSQIEGTQATLEDILDPKVFQNANRNVADVVNYIKATEFAIERLKELPLCSRLIKETHAILMENVRGQERMPGEFRHLQNWIGSHGSPLETARYIPPAPEDMATAMSDLEKYIHDDDDLDVLIRAALIHYQFETIHPFLDGNGRMGRLLVTLFFLEKSVLSTPALYISYFLKKNRMEYYDRMNEVRNKGHYEAWVKFFLQAIYESAQDAIATVDKLASLRDSHQKLVAKLGRSAKTAMCLLTYLEANPIMEIQRTAIELKISFKTISDAVRRLCDAKILIQTNGGRRNRVFAYEAYLNILKEGT
jgi:Fic family protein